MHSYFQRATARLFFRMAFLGLASYLSAQQVSNTTPPSIAVADAIPDAPAPQIEPPAAVHPKSGQSQSAQQPATGSENFNNESGQSASIPEAQSGTISGTVMDVQDEIVPGATIVLEGAVPADYRKIVADDEGAFVLNDLRPGVTYHVTIQASGFVEWKSPAIVLSPGQFQFVTNIQLQLKGEQTSVMVYASPEELATEQVKIAEQQRVFGIVPNFYVVYDSANASPLTPKLKYKLALKVSFDPVTLVGVLFMAGINQGSRIPDYPLGAKGYGERVGAVAADGFSDILIGGAVLPSLLHQDPRYFYQGTGTNKSRFLHAVSYPFICRGDNGRRQPNYSTIGGDVASTALENLYFPQSDRTASFAIQEVLIGTAERAASSLLQEFVLRKFTSQSRPKN